MSKFKVGDIVRTVNSPNCPDDYVGKVGVIVEILKDNFYDCVVAYNKDDFSNTLYQFYHELELTATEVENISDNVNQPNHYTVGGIETIDKLEALAWAMGNGITHFEFGCLMNVGKYMDRCKHKGKEVEDLQKSNWYWNKAIDSIYQRYTNKDN